MGSEIGFSKLIGLLGCARGTVKRWRNEKGFPEPVRPEAHTLRWRLGEVAVWMDAHPALVARKRGWHGPGRPRACRELKQAA